MQPVARASMYQGSKTEMQLLRLTLVWCHTEPQLEAAGLHLVAHTQATPRSVP